MTEGKKKSSSVAHRCWTVVGIILCVILVPVLVINIALIVRSFTNKDDVPQIGGYCPMIVLTGSMEPKISSGDLIICKQIDGKDVKKGDIIAFFDPDGNGTSVLTHRVTEVIKEDGKISFRTKGDANPVEDQKPVAAEKLVGIYRTKISGAGNVAMFMQTTTGLIVCVGIPLIILIGYDLVRRKAYEKRNQQDTEALLAELNELKAEKAQKLDEDETSDD
jgi:signal peptidase